MTRQDRSPITSIVLLLLILGCAASVLAPAASGQGGTNLQTFMVKGMVKEVAADGRTLVIRHEAIPGYMDAMTMPFRVKAPEELKGLGPGDEIMFQLRVTSTESWVDGISKVKAGGLNADKPAKELPAGAAQAPRKGHPLMNFQFTNELGQVMSLGGFRGQALAITFFYSRCPIPDYCPRLSKNFQEASSKLSSMPGAPTNWHFLSFSFDTAFDTPQVLEAYGQTYHYDPTRWSFLTGPREKINELAALSGVEVIGEAGLFNHNFRTLIIDATGRLQTTFPFGGDLSDAIVTEMLKAATATNAFAARDLSGTLSTSMDRTAPARTTETGRR